MEKRTPNDSDFLNWVADRLVHVYGESENVDFVRRLRILAREHSMGVIIPTKMMESAIESRGAGRHIDYEAGQ